MRKIEEYNQVIELLNGGTKLKDIATRLSLPLGTIKKWKAGGFHTNLKKRHFNFEEFSQSPERKRNYAFILGEYLGDGYICKHPRSYRLRIANTLKYTENSKLIRDSLSKIFPTNKCTIENYSKDNVSIISVYSQSLPLLFPQHGEDAKHTREIKLEAWQLEIVETYPQEFLKGLFWSDGCRYKQHKRNYYLYNFTNRSKDIINIISNILKQLNIHFVIYERKKRPLFILSIKRKDEAFKLDQFIGPKS